MADQRISRTKKTELSEFNLEEMKGWILDQMYNIESQVDFIIRDYFNPEKKYEFDKIILNSSIITIGGKMKILRNIKSFDNKMIDKILKFSTIRNAFAHLPITENFQITLKRDENGIFKDSEVTNSSSQIEIMNSNGVLKKKNVQELIAEFSQLNTEISKYLLSANKHS